LTAAALALVIGSALLHATWNLLAKRARGGVAFLFLLTAGTAVVYAPVAAVYGLLARPQLTAGHAAAAFVSGIIHVGYFVCLQRGYRAGDLSLVYPLARGSGPAIATVLAILVLGERPSAPALCGAALVVLSVLVLTGRRAPGSTAGGSGRAAVLYGLATGVFIGAYTVWDGWAVRTLGAPPVLYLYMGEVSRLVLLAPLVLTRLPAGELASAWREGRREALGVSVLSPLAYLLVLTAMSFTPVSLIAPAREVSILVGAALGALLLREGFAGRRLAGAAGMVAGVVLLSLG
jgi:drug/metabolite transporter (DMT)-like permease